MTHDIKENRRRCEERIAKGEYDVFLSYNRKDQEYVLQISKWLKDNGIAPWLDIWDLRPGFIWQKQVGEQIKKSKAAAVCVGKWGIGDWEEEEMYVLLNAFVKRNNPLIPVLLENAPYKPELPPFLGARTWADFRKAELRNNVTDPLERLIYGITGAHPPKVYRPGILVAALGESPVVIPAMYDLLAKEEKLTLDRTVVLYPKSSNIQYTYEHVEKKLKGVCLLEPIELDFEDADSWRNACAFLKRLFRLLQHYQDQKEDVYLSLAGGRKSMAGLMAWVVPFFSCVKGVYYVFDKDEKYFKPTEKIRPADMQPDLKKLTFVPIPFKDGQLTPDQHIGAKIGADLLSTPSHRFEEIEALVTAQTIIQADDTPLLHVRLTKMAIKQFYRLLQPDQDKTLAHHVLTDLLSMSNLETLRKQSTALKKVPNVRQKISAFAGVHSPLHPFFYTEPSDIHTDPPGEVSDVIVVSLEEEGPNGYRSAKDVAGSPGFSVESDRIVDVLPSITSPVDSVLIVPLGKAPMVATQLYTLLTEQEQHTIHEMVLVYPEEQGICNGAQMIERIFKDKIHPCKITLVPIKELSDIASEEDCTLYQSRLEAEIKRVRNKYPTYTIDLALSGGRRGMTAMTILAAQKQGNIPYVYHTLITDKDIYKKIEKETSLEALDKNHLNDEDRYQRLSLRKYLQEDKEEEAYPYEYFTLFKVPVFRPDGW